MTMPCSVVMQCRLIQTGGDKKDLKGILRMCVCMHMQRPLPGWSAWQLPQQPPQCRGRRLPLPAPRAGAFHEGMGMGVCDGVQSWQLSQGSETFITFCHETSGQALIHCCLAMNHPRGLSWQFQKCVLLC